MYLVEKILPVLEETCSDEESSELKLDIYKILAEICAHKISDETLHMSLETIFSRLLVRFTRHITFLLKAHKNRMRFGNATRILDFQGRSTLILFHFFQTFGNILAFETIWSAYLAKVLSIDSLVYF